MTKVHYVRLFADDDGESHFSEEEMDLTSVDFAPPAPPLHLSAFAAAKQMAFVAREAGWFGDWHPAPRRQFYILLAGEVEAQASDGEVRRFRAGDIVLLEDTTGKGHTSRVNLGDIAAIIQLAD